MSSVLGVRYRCNLGLWVVTAMAVLPYAVIALLRPAFIALRETFSG